MVVLNMEVVQMKKGVWIRLIISASFLFVFMIWTVLLLFVDVQAIGPQETTVGFAGFNRVIRDFVGVRMSLYAVTDWLGLAPLLCVVGFGIFGLMQWIKRKNILKVDYDILVLGLFYVTVLLVFLLFEVLAINYRPILIEGKLEASYPSSTTLLVVSVIPTVILQCNARVKKKGVKIAINAVMVVFIGFMVGGRIFSGVHWITDIIGGALLGVSLVMLYSAIVKIKSKN